MLRALAGSGGRRGASGRSSDPGGPFAALPCPARPAHASAPTPAWAVCRKCRRVSCVDRSRRLFMEGCISVKTDHSASGEIHEVAGTEACRGIADRGIARQHARRKIDFPGATGISDTHPLRESRRAACGSFFAAISAAVCSNSFHPLVSTPSRLSRTLAITVQAASSAAGMLLGNGPSGSVASCSAAAGAFSKPASSAAWSSASCST